MSHPLLSRYPQLYGKLLFLDVHLIPNRLYPLLSPPPQAPTEHTMREFHKGFKRDYANAKAEDFIFICQNVPCASEADADQMYFRTSLVDKNGCRIWLHAILNRIPDKSRWYVIGFTSREVWAAAQPAISEPEPAPSEPEPVLSEPEPAPSEPEPVPSDPEPAPAAADDRPLLERYPCFSDLVFLNDRKINEWLIPLVNDTTLTSLSVNTFLNDQYQKKGLEVCRFTLKGKEATPETADTLNFTTGYQDSEGKDIFLQCERNKSADHLEPWFGKFFNLKEHTGLSSKPLLRKLRIFHVDNLDYFEPVDMIKSSSSKDRIAQIADCYEKRPEAVEYYKDCWKVDDEDIADQMIVPSGYHVKGGEEIMLRCKRNKSKNPDYPWVSRRFFLPSQNDFQGKRMNKWLTSWAGFQTKNPSDLSRALKILKDMAMDEPWSLSGKDDLSILRNYLTYTFVRLWREKKVKEGENYAAFNTGLVDHAYRYIYAIFERVSDGEIGGRKWLFRDFCLDSVRYLGKKVLRNHFDSLPQPARYFDSNVPIYYCFDDSRNVNEQIPHYSEDHILLERTSRLPISFLRNFDRLVPGLTEKLDALEAFDPKEDPQRQRDLWKEVSDLLWDSNGVYLMMCGSLKNSVETAVRRAAWNYRTTVPYYDPSGDNICLLLPISLAIESIANNKPDVAMVLEPKVDETGKTPISYTGHTIITMAMAYSNSRLVCRPESDWLNAEAISDAEDEDDFNENGEDGDPTL